jgi:ABC-type transport system substrate-binding protein
MEIHIYTNPDTENADLQKGDLDINDWPLGKEWIDAWALMPEEVTMDGYVELGMDGVSLNSQMWPTGDSANKFYTPGSAMANRSLAFRQAVTYLMDKDAVITQVLKGYGYKMIVPLPPFQSAFEDMLNYTNTNMTYKIGAGSYTINSTEGGITYPYNPAMADYVLDSAGFVMGTGEWRIDPLTLKDLDPIIFYIRQDDPIRLQMGQMLATELKNHGIPVNAIITEKTVCFKNVMVLYNYHLYTEGWSLGLIPFYHDGYSSVTYFGPSVGWSTNYPGFCNTEFDYWADASYYPATMDDAVTACINAGYVFLKYCANMPVYCNNAVKAYKTGTTGVINNAGFGIDNYYTFLNGNVSDGQWDYGFKADIEQLNAVTSEWLWDWNCIGLMYESLMGTNPFNLAMTEYWIANGYSIGTWNATSAGGDSDATYINFTLRDNVRWHNNTVAGRLLNASDIKFSFDFTYACGPGVAWNYPSVSAYDHSTVYNGTLIGIYFIYKSAWALLQAQIPIIKPELWGSLQSASNFPANVRTYDPVTMDNNNNGLLDIYEDGTGAWIFGTYVKSNYITLAANTYYYLTQTAIADRLKDMFWSGAGDVNKDGVVNTQDLGLMARALFTNSTYSPGGAPPNWYAYNQDCDFDSNTIIDANDLAVVTSNYGKTAG